MLCTIVNFLASVIYTQATWEKGLVLRNTQRRFRSKGHSACNSLLKGSEKGILYEKMQYSQHSIY